MEPADWIEEIEETSAKNKWLKKGYENGWISDTFCVTHQGAPWSEEEEAEWDDGGDPCALCVRILE